MKVYTNHHKRQFKYRMEVPKAILDSEFDWTTEDDIDGYFCYRNNWYHTSDFMCVEDGMKELSDWDGYHSDSFFSGIVIKLLLDDFDGEFIVGTYIT